MATQSIGYSSSVYDYYTNSAQEGLTNSQSSSSSRDTAFGSDIREKVESLLADVPRNANGTLTFEAVMEYRDSLLDDFENTAKAGLDALGVDTDRDMAFTYDAVTDTLTVDSSHPDKAVIDQYFTEQDDLRLQFAQVLALNKMTGAAESKLSVTDMRTELRVQSMAIWAENNTENLFVGGNLLTSAATGISSFVGVDLVV